MKLSRQHPQTFLPLSAAVELRSRGWNLAALKPSWVQSAAYALLQGCPSVPAVPFSDCHLKPLWFSRIIPRVQCLIEFPGTIDILAKQASYPCGQRACLLSLLQPGSPSSPIMLWGASRHCKVLHFVDHPLLWPPLWLASPIGKIIRLVPKSCGPLPLTTASNTLNTVKTRHLGSCVTERGSL